MINISYKELKEILLAQELAETIERRKISRIFFIDPITGVRVRPVTRKMNIVLYFPINKDIRSQLKEVEWSIDKEIRCIFKGIDEELWIHNDSIVTIQ